MCRAGDNGKLNAKVKGFLDFDLAGLLSDTFIESIIITPGPTICSKCNEDGKLILLYAKHQTKGKRAYHSLPETNNRGQCYL